jgi:hypothetical protein
MKIVVGCFNVTKYRDGSRYIGEMDENENACGQGIVVRPDGSFAKVPSGRRIGSSGAKESLSTPTVSLLLVSLETARSTAKEF